MDQEIILFDFEYTAWEGSWARKWSEPWEHREIIQIAAVRVVIDGAVTEQGSFDCLVRPKRNPRPRSTTTPGPVAKNDVPSPHSSLPRLTGG